MTEKNMFIEKHKMILKLKEDFSNGVQPYSNYEEWYKQLVSHPFYTLYTEPEDGENVIREYLIKDWYEKDFADDETNEEAFGYNFQEHKFFNDLEPYSNYEEWYKQLVSHPFYTLYTETHCGEGDLEEYYYEVCYEYRTKIYESETDEEETDEEETDEEETDEEIYFRNLPPDVLDDIIHTTYNTYIK